MSATITPQYDQRVYTGDKILLDGSGGAYDYEFTPRPGQWVNFRCTDATGDCTVSLQGSWTYDGTNNTATFDAAEEQLIVWCTDDYRVNVVQNTGSVALSAV